MPETAIGFFADVGGSFFMSRLANSIGLYLVLTGNRLKGEDVKRTGIATHYMNSKKMLDLERILCETDNLSPGLIEIILETYQDKVEGEYNSDKISEIFSLKNFDEIVSKLREDVDSEWSQKQLSLFTKMSPTSLRVAVKQLDEGSKMDLKNCLKMEYQLCQRFIEDGDFFEGVRALLVDRDNSPKWVRSSVDNEKIEWFFKPLPEDHKLEIEI
jgi:3-hydroxyisobutyryl-CoA hydrolase